MDSMPETTAEDVADDFQIEREALGPALALANTAKAAAAIAASHLAKKLCPCASAQKRATIEPGRAPRATTLEALAKLKGVVRPDGTVAAGNASGVNDGACALLLANGKKGRPASTDLVALAPAWSAWPWPA